MQKAGQAIKAAVVSSAAVVASQVWASTKSNGLSPAEIADKYALPTEPTHMCDVKIDPNTKLEVGITNAVEGWGSGGGVQFDTMGEFLPRTSFINETIIGG